MSRVRENRTHGSRWRREETGTSRHSRAELGASRRPYIGLLRCEAFLRRVTGSIDASAWRRAVCRVQADVEG